MFTNLAIPNFDPTLLVSTEKPPSKHPKKVRENSMFKGTHAGSR